MTKRSGFAVKITAFIEADATDAEQMGHALSVIGGLSGEMKRLGFIGAECAPRFMLSKDIPDDPAALAQEQIEERAAQGALNAHPGFGDKRSDEMPPIPPNLDRRRA